MLAVAVLAVAVAAAACLPAGPPTTTTPPPGICGIGPATAAAPATAPDAGPPDSNRYVAVVRRYGRSEVFQRTVRSPEELERFRADAAAVGELVSLAPDGEVHATAETPTWGFVDSNFSAAWNAASGTTGTGVRVALLDTGVDTSHPELAGHFDAAPGADVVAAPDKSNPPPSAIDPSSSGHGTHVAGILAATANNGVGVAGGAPGVTIVPVRVLGTTGAGTYSDVAAGLLWAADVTKGNAQVVSMSLGSEASSATLIAAIQAVEDVANPNYTHPVITVAAGNSACSSTQFPASLESTYPAVLAVAALCKVGVTSSCPDVTPWPADGAYKLATYSARAWDGIGAPSGITAPGTQITSTLPGGAYGVKSGTSMAAPFVAAGAALVLAHCGPLSSSYTAGDVVNRLESSARDLGPAGPDQLYGFGMLDADAAVQGC
jgi:subtilisin family serine protease